MECLRTRPLKFFKKQKNIGKDMMKKKKEGKNKRS